MSFVEITSFIFFLSPNCPLVMELGKDPAHPQPIPIILCGKSLENGEMVSQILKPDFEGGLYSASLGNSINSVWY